MFYALKEGDKRGQVTVFIIVAVLIVAGIVLYFVLSSDSGDSPEVSGDQEVQSPSAFLSSCMEDNVRNNLRKMRLRGGFMEPSPSVEFKFVNDTNPISRDIAYLCHTNSEGNACVVQNAALVSGMENELEKELGEVSEECFSNLKDAYRDQGYDVSGGNYNSQNDFVADLSEDEARFNLNASRISLEKTNDTRGLEEFSFNIYSLSYNFGEIANDIVEQERNTGSVDLSQFLEDYPNYKLDYEVLPDQSKIYTLEHRERRTKFRFAVRSYPLP